MRKLDFGDKGLLTIGIINVVSNIIGWIPNESLILKILGVIAIPFYIWVGCKLWLKEKPEEEE